jgi:hypothetical protein
MKESEYIVAYFLRVEGAINTIKVRAEEMK